MSKGQIAWLDLVERDPELGMILWEAMMVMDDKRKQQFCATRFWVGTRTSPGLQTRLGRHVGPQAYMDDPVLRSAEAYEMAIRVVHDALPPCRNCGCA